MAQKDPKRRAAVDRDGGSRRARTGASVVAVTTDPRPRNDASRVAPKPRSPNDLTTSNKIMVAAAQIAETRETFTAEDLIVVAWKLFPESFALSGYRELYPDSNRVLSKLMGSVGLCSRGWLEQVSTKTYKMTAAGRKLLAGLATPTSTDEPAVVAERASVRRAERPRSEPPRPAARVERAMPETITRAVAAVPPPPAPSRARPAPEPTHVRPTVVTPARGRPTGALEGLPVLQRLATSAASQKFSRGGLVTFADACAFWAITPGLHASQLPPRLAEIETLLRRAEAHIQSTGASVRIHDRLELTLTTVIGLQGLHGMLMQKYSKQLENIRGQQNNNNGEEEER